MPDWASNITQGYGPTSEVLDGPYKGYDHFNKGYDFGLASGTPIDAHIRGTVVGVSNDPDNSTGWGKYVWVEDANGNIHRFNHLDSTGGKKVGDSVNVGDVIGTSGNTGRSTGPHLSYDVSDPDGNYIDPSPFLGGGFNGRAPLADTAYPESGSGMPDLGTLLGLTGGVPGGGSTSAPDWQKKISERRDYLMGRASEFQSRGMPVPDDLMKEIRDLYLLDQAGQGIFEEDEDDVSPEDRYLQRLSVLGNLLGAGVGLGNMKASAAASKLSAYNDQYQAGLVSPTGYKFDQTPGSFMRNVAGLTDQNDAAYVTQKGAPPSPDEITSAGGGGFQEALNWVFGQAGADPGAKAIGSGSGSGKSWEDQLKELLGDTETARSVFSPGVPAGRPGSFMDAASGAYSLKGLQPLPFSNQSIDAGSNQGGIQGFLNDLFSIGPDVNASMLRPNNIGLNSLFGGLF